MNILYEDTMPHGADYFCSLGHAKPYSWQTLTSECLIDIDVLAIRSTTKITPKLLSKANRLHTVATATAGTNHMDIPFLQKAGINYYSAGGCNAIAVAQYVVSAIMFAHDKRELDFNTIEVGIVGAGNVGSTLAKYLDALSISYVLCDPPIEHQDPRNFVDLDRALACDVVSLHVPYVQTGEHLTANMLSASRLDKMTTNQWLINACRGEVLDESHLLSLKKANLGPQLVLDVWLNEPKINTELLPFVRLGTPHIAGHTDEGKIRGTQMVYDYLCSKTSTKSEKVHIDQFLPRLEPLEYGYGDSAMPMSQFLQRVYDIHFDHRIFVENMSKSPAFSKLRKQYQGRREYNAFYLHGECKLSEKERAALSALGFTFLPDNNA
ncbi:4-phosphoerythronate dehydrogenase [Alteromonas sp. 5E99-2]|uniref:4-phosphoerythronate dehydrogenase n=1 Tax=Alteromonas sp. 5E99-2 TaxID=2817683 RepID=UPI001A985312|nr:4-phosphoerythronate dehydrogenase [Alteromonas sp. 5E99-2]MBO1255108.1 4-phosphoerythronate dehydrogenase [Alteromonas sp. 5E99-2]